MVRRFAFGWGLGSVAALCAVWCGSAQAETAAEILSTFNLVTEGNVTTGSDIEGSTVVGGNLSGATFFGNNTPANPLLVIYGNITDSINPTANKPQTVELTHAGQEFERPLQRALYVHLAADLAVERLYHTAERAIDSAFEPGSDPGRRHSR